MNQIVGIAGQIDELKRVQCKVWIPYEWIKFTHEREKNPADKITEKKLWQDLCPTSHFQLENCLLPFVLHWHEKSAIALFIIFHVDYMELAIVLSANQIKLSAANSE